MRLRLNYDSAVEARERMIKRMYQLKEPIDFTDEENKDGAPYGNDNAAGPHKRKYAYFREGTVEELNQALQNGTISKKLDAKKQSKHHEGTDSYKREVAKGRKLSIITISDEEAAQLVDKYSGTGDIFISKEGQIKENVEHTENVGYYMSQRGEKKETKRFTIHYSKSGTHIVPAGSQGGKNGNK